MELHFDSPTQAVHYFILCLVSILGVTQIVAAQSNRYDLLWLVPRTSFFLGALVIPASFLWFFLTDEGIFVPGLAGGERIAIFMAAFLVAMPLTRVIAYLFARSR